MDSHRFAAGDIVKISVYYRTAVEMRYPVDNERPVLTAPVAPTRISVEITNLVAGGYEIMLHGELRCVREGDVSEF